ncbi:MAG: hypothetical protein IH594_15080 [Bacteroidales bacterium]|nr:hypothetical protein [Bacteroidales bacterium]
MKIVKIVSGILILLFQPGIIRAQVPVSKDLGRSEKDFIYIENEILKLGIDTSMGGAITYLEMKEHGENMVNNFDLGRQVQISFFGGPIPLFLLRTNSLTSAG